MMGAVLLACWLISDALARPLGTYADWWLGRTNYLGACARCHGEDGAANTYSGIKILAGLGKRVGEDGIRKRLPMAMLGPDHFVIRSYSFNKREITTLIAYIAKL